MDMNEAREELKNQKAQVKVQGNVINTGDSSQVIIVYTQDYGQVLAAAEEYQKSDNVWHKVRQFPVNIGSNGFAAIGGKREGDGKSPQGSFSFDDFMFGQAADPGVKYRYKQVDDQDFWVDDENSVYYDRYKRGRGGFNSAENLNIHSYLYAGVINYNTNKTPGLGSAIFFHLWSAPGHGTAGCVATDENNLKDTLKWLDPSMKPRIIMGLTSNLERF